MNSQFFQAIADLLRLIESQSIPSDQYGITDAGQTLECSKALRDRIQHTPEFKAFEAVGGSCSCYDDDDWMVL